MMSEENLREQLYAAYKHRAILYWLIFDELRNEVGQDKAAEILRRAIYRRGEAIGQKYAEFAPDNFDGLRQAFLDGIPDDGQMFAPEVQRCDTSGLDMRLKNCPLKDAWKEAGLSDEDVATMCQIAAEIDQGTFEGAGFSFSANTWKPGQEGCCNLHVRPGRQATGS